MRLPVEPPFNLEATVRLLQRRPRNPLDRWTGDAWLRLLARPDGPVAVRVEQIAPDALALSWPLGRPSPGEARAIVALVRRTLGLDTELGHFHRAIDRFPALTPLAPILRGVRPPRFTSLFEAIVGVVPFQQVSLDAGITLFGRLVERFGIEQRLPTQEESLLFASPLPETIAEAPVEALRALGLSATKARALRAAAEAIGAGRLREAELATSPIDEARARLVELPGIGPWSADLVLLRGFGRLDAFPPGDVGVARGLAKLLGGAEAPEKLAAAFAPQQGMLYYTSLVAQLHARGLLG